MTKLTSRRMRFLLQLLCLLLLGPLTEATQDVLTQHNDNQRTGATLRETVLNVSNANERTFGWRWDYQVEGDMYAQPLYVDQAPYRNERGEEFRKNVIYVATMQNLIYAFDADGPGSALWSYDAGSFKPNPFGQPVSTDDKQLYDTDESKYNIRPFVGITS